MKSKYKVEGSIRLKTHRPTNSPMWNDLVKIKDIYLKGRMISIGNGETNFWEDSRCVLVSFKEKFNHLLEICEEQNNSVAWLAARRWRLRFRKWLDERAQNQLRQLGDMLQACALSTENDDFNWFWEKTGKFTVSSLYSHLCSNEIYNSNNKLWKSKIPLKIKIFMWLVGHNHIMTKDNMIKRNWLGDKRCYFCN